MNNFDDIFVDQKTGETANNKDFVPFNKDEWAARKQQERADAYALIDRAAEDAAKDGGVFQGYLDVQSRFDRYSVGNALLITIQMPEATRLADYNGWKDNNVYVKKGATGITILEPGDEYTREDLDFDCERISNMLRAMTAISFQKNCGSANLRQEHDAICDWVFDKEPDFKAFEEGTTKLDRADMEKAKDLFYDIFGWDKTTGVPTRETLEKFDLGDMADDLEARGIYAQTEAAAQ